MGPAIFDPSRSLGLNKRFSARSLWRAASSRMWIAATEKTIVHDLDLRTLDIKQKKERLYRLQDQIVIKKLDTDMGGW